MKLTWKTTLVTLGLMMSAVGIAAGLAYAAVNNKEFDVPIQATVTVKIASAAEAADVNGDGQVDGKDLKIVSRNLNTTVPPGDERADVDKSGRVGVRDLAFVARFFKQLVTPALDTTPPGKPTLISPPDGSTGDDTTPTFIWTLVTGDRLGATVTVNFVPPPPPPPPPPPLPEPLPTTYSLEIAFGTADFTNLAFTADGIQTTQFTLNSGDALAAGDYIWHVRAVDGAGNTGDFSDPFIFTVIPTHTPTTVQVDMGNFFFSPKSVPIKVGDTVVWTVTAGGDTTASGQPGNKTGIWDSDFMTVGETFSFTSTEAGTFPYFCEIHGSAMVGTVTVTQ